MLKVAVAIVALLSTASIVVAAEEKMVADMNKLTCGELTNSVSKILRG